MKSMRREATSAGAVVAAGFAAAASAQTSTEERGVLETEAVQAFDAVPADAAAPFGGVAIAPTRVVLSDAERTGRVSLYNAGSVPVTYRIEAVDLVPQERGGFAEMAADAPVPDWSARSLVRFAPRQVTLAGGQRQVVKLISRARRDTPPAEYRTHLRFSSIPLVEALEPEDVSDVDDDRRALSISVGMEYRVTIPVLLRIGELDEGTRISAAALERDPAGSDVVAVDLSRTGARSSFLNLRLLDADGAEVGAVRRLSVLPPLARRRVLVAVREGAGTPVRVVLESAEEDREDEVLSEAVIG